MASNSAVASYYAVHCCHHADSSQLTTVEAHDRSHNLASCGHRIADMPACTVALQTLDGCYTMLTQHCCLTTSAKSTAGWHINIVHVCKENDDCLAQESLDKRRRYLGNGAT